MEKKSPEVLDTADDGTKVYVPKKSEKHNEK